MHSGLLLFTQERAHDRRVHCGSLGFTHARLGMAGFIGVRVGSLSSIICCRVHSSSRLFTLAHLGVVEFIRVREGSLGRAKWLSGSFLFAWIHSGTYIGRRDRLQVVGFIQVRVCLAGTQAPLPLLLPPPHLTCCLCVRVPLPCSLLKCPYCPVEMLESEVQEIKF